jgi:glucose/arabinose dehydrogenase
MDSLDSNLIFIDANITDYLNLIPENNHEEIIILDRNRDGIEQITDVLANQKNSTIDSIQIISHGDRGKLQLGNAILTTANLSSYQKHLVNWQSALSQNADLLFYGCNLAGDESGVNFVQKFSQMTNADIAASQDLTGNSALGGNWTLEFTIGDIEVSTIAVPRYNSILATYNGNEYVLTNTASSWTEAQAEATARGGNLVTINDSAEEAWLKQTFGENSGYWIGINDVESEGNFEWVSSQPVSYTNWAPGEPNNNGSQDYGWMNYGNTRQWDDVGGAAIFRGIIEIGDANPTQPQVFTYNGNEYRLTSGISSWQQAQAEATARGGNLVTINDSAEEAWLKQTFGESGYWIGINDVESEGNFEWVSSQPVSYTNWAPGEPNNNGSQDYGWMNYGNTRQWDDVGGAALFPGIIEVGDDNSLKPGVIGLVTNTYQVNEENGTVEVTILRTQGNDGAITVDYQTFDASATAGEDYLEVSGTVTFADGETSKTVSIPILDDNQLEEKENFSFTIDNVTGGATLLVPRTALINILDDEAELDPIFDFDNFSDVSQLAFNGSAGASANVLRLTSATNNQAGSAFFKRPLAINTDTFFSNQFQFRISGGQGSGGADGLIFMLQNSNDGLNALGFTGGDLGYGNVQNASISNIGQSLAIEFDTYRNSWDTNNNHISVLRDGNVSNALVTVNAPLDLNNGSVITTWIDYNGATNLLEVFLASSTVKPETAFLSLNIDLVSVVGSQASLGFSAGTGGLTNNHEIQNWQLTTNSTLLPEPPPPLSLTSETVISGLNQPTAIEWTPDGETLFIAEKRGVIKVFKDGQLRSVPFIDIADRVNGVRDRGLLDLAVHPDFFNGSPYVYALYTYDPPQVFQNTGLAGPDGIGNRAARLTRITADASTNFTTAIPGSEVVILGANSTWENFNAFANSTNNFNEPAAGILADGTNLQDFLAADSESHTIGAVEFGTDGALYVSNGDGTSYNRVDPRTVRVQDIDNLSGKILRIDPITGKGLADNPFYNGNPDANRSKVYQYGLRNPFRITIDPRNNDLYVGDVGWTQWEEINRAEAGANFGWPYYEGGSGNNLQTGGYRDLPAAQSFYSSGQTATPAIRALNHSTDGINAIVLGDIYTGDAFPEEYRGDLFFSDLGQGIVRNISFDESGNITSVDTFTTGANVVVQIIQAPNGSLYYVDLDDGLVGRWQFV